MGGLFALAFAAVYGRVGRASPATTALWLAGAAFLVVFLVPFLKYPANPPAVGDPETINDRTLTYLTMVAISVLAAVAALRVRSGLAGLASLSSWSSSPPVMRDAVRQRGPRGLPGDDAVGLPHRLGGDAGGDVVGPGRGVRRHGGAGHGRQADLLDPQIHTRNGVDMKELAYKIEDLNPVLRTRLDSPYEISNELYATLRHVLHDVGGQPDAPQPYLEKEEEEWEMNTYVTCECLGWRGVWNSEERRRRENDLGATLYFGLPYYARWATTAAKMLIDKGHVTPDELSAKLDEVRARLEAER